MIDSTIIHAHYNDELDKNLPSTDNENELLDDNMEEAVVGWDEGGRSHCGFQDGIHDVLMLIGASVHSLFGEPSESLKDRMVEIGNNVQEISYTVREWKRGQTMEESLRAASENDDVSSLGSECSDGEE